MNSTFFLAFQDTKDDSSKEELPPFIEGRVHSGTLIKDVIGFICWKYFLEERVPPLISDSLGMILYEMSIITIFGYMHFKQKIITKSYNYHEKFYCPLILVHLANLKPC